MNTRSAEFKINRLSDFNEINPDQDVSTLAISGQIWQGGKSAATHLALEINKLPVRDLILRQGPYLTAECIIEFFSGLSANKTLQLLDCTGIFLSSNEFIRKKQFISALEDLLNSAIPLRKFIFSRNYLTEGVLGAIAFSGKIRELDLQGATWEGGFEKNKLVEILIHENSSLHAVNLLDVWLDPNLMLKLLTANSNLRVVHLPYHSEAYDKLNKNKHLINQSIISFTIANEYKYSFNNEFYSILFENNRHMRLQIANCIKKLITLAKAQEKNFGKNEIVRNLGTIPIEIVFEILGFTDNRKEVLSKEQIKAYLEFIHVNIDMSAEKLFHAILKQGVPFNQDATLLFYFELEKIAGKISTKIHCPLIPALCQNILKTNIDITLHEVKHLALINIAVDNLKKCIKHFSDCMEINQKNVSMTDGFSLIKKYRISKANEILEKSKVVLISVVGDYLRSINQADFSLNLFIKALENIISNAEGIDKNYAPIRSYCEEIKNIIKEIRCEFEHTKEIGPIDFGLNSSDMKQALKK